VFDPKSLAAMSEGGPPERLRVLDEDVVARLISIIRSEFAGALPWTLRFELEGFERDRTVFDARRVANALRHHYDREGLAREIEDAIEEGGP
jgi:hypothetical protein